MYETIVQREGNRFYHVDEATIYDVQEELGLILPRALIEFYKEIGYGFLHSKKYYFNRLMSPKSLCDFRLRKGPFRDIPELKYYEECEHDQIVFFEVSEGYYLSIGFSKSNNGRVFCANTLIAESLAEFLVKYQEDENYFD